MRRRREVRAQGAPEARQGPSEEDQAPQVVHEAEAVLEPPRHRNNGGPVRNHASYTEADDVQHTGLILGLRLQRATTSQIARTMHQQHGVGVARVRSLLGNALAALTTEVTEHRPHARAETVTRLRMDVARLRQNALQAEAGPAQERWWRLVKQFEELLAQVEGTLAPIEVQIDVRSVHVEFVQEITEEQRQVLLDRARENARLARSDPGITPRPGLNGTGHH